MKVLNRSVNLLGKRSRPPQNTKSCITSNKAQKKEHKNPEKAIDDRNLFEDAPAPKEVQPKRSHKATKKKEEGIKEHLKSFKYDHQATQTHLLTKQASTQTGGQAIPGGGAKFEPKRNLP